MLISRAKNSFTMCDFFSVILQQNHPENEHAEGFCYVTREALMSVVLTFLMALGYHITPLTKENVRYYSGVIVNEWSKDAARFF